MEEEQCECCRIGIGGVEENYISEYREHRICSYCQLEWVNREDKAGREITWKEFVSGKLRDNKILNLRQIKLKGR